MRCGEVDHESMGGKLECAVLCEGSYRPRLDQQGTEAVRACAASGM
jgi:hypothetical protein